MINVKYTELIVINNNYIMSDTASVFIFFLIDFNVI